MARTWRPSFRGDPLLTSEEQTRFYSLVKDQKDRQGLGKAGGGRGAVQWGPGRQVGARLGEASGGAKESLLCGKKFVSGSSQLIASSVSS